MDRSIVQKYLKEKGYADRLMVSGDKKKWVSDVIVEFVKAKHGLKWDGDCRKVDKVE